MRRVLAQVGLVLALMLVLACTESADKSSVPQFDPSKEPSKTGVNDRLSEITKDAASRLGINDKQDYQIKEERLTTDSGEAMLPRAQVTPPNADRKDMRVITKNANLSYVAMGFLQLKESFYLQSFAPKLVGKRLADMKASQSIVTVLEPSGLELLMKNGRLDLPLLQSQYPKSDQEHSYDLYRAEVACISDRNGDCISGVPAPILGDARIDAGDMVLNPFSYLLALNVSNHLNGDRTIRVDFYPLNQLEKDHAVRTDHVSNRFGYVSHPGENPHVKQILDDALETYRRVYKPGMHEPKKSMRHFVDSFGLADCKFMAMANVTQLEEGIVEKKLSSTTRGFLVSGYRLASAGATVPPETIYLDLVNRNHAWNGAYKDERLESLVMYDTTRSQSEMVTYVFNRKSYDWFSHKLAKLSSWQDVNKFFDGPFPKSKLPSWGLNEGIHKDVKTVAASLVSSDMQEVGSGYGYITYEDKKQGIMVVINIAERMVNLGYDGGGVFIPNSVKGQVSQFWSMPFEKGGDYWHGQASREDNILYGLNFDPSKLTENYRVDIVSAKESRDGYDFSEVAKGAGSKYFNDFIDRFPTTNNALAKQYSFMGEGFAPADGVYSTPTTYPYKTYPSIQDRAAFWTSKGFRVRPRFRIDLKILVQGK